MKELLPIGIAALLMATSAAAAQAQTQQSSPLKGIENLKAAHTSCVERTFHLGDTT